VSNSAHIERDVVWQTLKLARFIPGRGSMFSLRSRNKSFSSSDRALLLRVLSGSEEAALSLYDKYCHFVYFAALRLSGDEYSAEQILHEVFMEVWRSPQHPETRGEALAARLLAVTKKRAEVVCQSRSGLPRCA
jgi:hypothetical protein